MEGTDGPVGSRPSADPRLSSPSAVLGILRDARKRAVAGDATVYAIRPSVKVAEIDLTVRISRGRDRCTATAAPCRAATIARAMTSERFAPIESVTRSGWQTLLIRLVSWERLPPTLV